MTSGIFGRRGNGKTTLGYYLVKQCRRRLVFDPRRMFPPSTHGNRTIVQSAADLEIAFENLLAGDAEMNEVIYAPVEDNIRASFHVFARLCKEWVLKRPDESIGILVDEISFADLENETWQWVMRCSGREVVSVFLTGHRPVNPELPTYIRTIIDHWYFFRTNEPNDLKNINERSVDTANAVQTLKPREFAHWDDEHGTGPNIGDEPDAWFVSFDDSSDAMTRSLKTRASRLF